MKPLAIAALFLAASAAAAPLPLLINFQGKLLDPATNNPRTAPVDFTFRLCNDPSASCASCPGAVCLWSESQTGVTVANGVFSVQLGASTPLSPDYFMASPVYLSVTASPDASEMLPRQQFLMSPFAFTAAQVVNSGSVRLNAGFAYSTFTSAGNLSVPFGVAAATGAFSGAGPAVFSLTTSSGIQIGAGTLDISGASGGINAQGTGINASTAVFTGSGAGVYSVLASSGIRLNGGTLDARGASGGIDAQGTGIIASTGTFTRTGGSSIVASSGIAINGGTLDVNGGGGIDAQGTGIIASTGVFTATGANQFSLTASSGVSVGGVLTVSENVLMGLTYRNLNGTNATLRCACTATGTKAVAGGCSQTTTNALRQSYPSTDTTDAIGTAGTAVANGATEAYSWTCVWSGSNAGNRCFAVCARMGN